jgi:HK97 family phage prohead protease
MADEQRAIARELQRTTPFALERAADDGGDVGDGLTLEGHAAVFNARTLIDSWEGRFWEQIAKGAFRKTFNERTPVLQFDHGHHPLIGSIPIGRISSAKEDGEGAYVKARLHDNWLIQPVRDAIREESITGMSFRFSVVKDEWRTPKGKLLTDPDDILQGIYSAGSDPEELLTRTLRELKVPELGPVVFPAYAETDVGVRSGQTVIDLGRLREDPDARKRLGRALWVAEQGASRNGDQQAAERVLTDTQAEQLITPALPPFTVNITIDGSRSAEQIANDIATAIRTAAHGGPYTPPADGDPPPDPQTSEDEQTEPAANATPDATPDQQDPAPATRHADPHDEPPGGHSSPAPNWAADPRARKAHMAYVREMSKAATDRRAIYERTVTRWEADQLASQDPDGPGDDQSTNNHEGTKD